MFWTRNSNLPRLDEELEEKRPQFSSSVQMAFSSLVYSPCVRSIQSYVSRNGVLSESSPEQSIWLQGTCYNSHIDSMGFEKFLHDFESKVWLTYRKDFKPFENSELTSDAGWGCMLRSGQMLLAQALILRHFGRSWRWNHENQERLYLQIIESFQDTPRAPFSIHSLIKAGATHGLTPGQWLGPSVLCQTLKNISSQDEASKLLSMAVYVAYGDRDGGGAPILCLDSLIQLCLGVSGVGSSGRDVGSQSGDDSWKPALILLPLMLGSDRVNPRYLPTLKKVFTFPQSLGILGGKPGGATYLIGLQGEDLIVMDPHQVQPVCEVRGPLGMADTTSYHCREPRKVPLQSIDPSMALAFYCASQDDLEDFCERAHQLAEGSLGAPLFTIGTLQNNRLTELQFSPQEAPLEGGAEGTEEEWQII